MSSMIYLASDTPLKELKNPHDRSLSVNEAIALGIELPSFLLEDGINRDQPDMILWSDREIAADADQDVDDGSLDDDFSIIPMEKQEDIFTKKRFTARLEWSRYTKGRAQKVIAYIKEQLENTQAVEIWHIWMGASYPPPKIKRVRLGMDDLDTQVLERLDAYPVWQSVPAAGPYAISKDWGIAEEEMEVCIQYCCEILGRQKKLPVSG